jgi:putative flavoprotein involved in K+ transport
MERLPVAIIGAGPAGLALGRHLRRCGIEFRIFEKQQVGASWKRMPNHLKLVSPWKWNWLDVNSRHRFAANAQLTRDEFGSYLAEFAREHELPISDNCDAQEIARAGTGFVVRTTCGDFEARIVVSATGYFSNPVVPGIIGADETHIRRIHYADYTDARAVAADIGNGGRVLLVGKRLSAGQIALELVDAGLDVAISHRTPIRFGVDDWLWPAVYRTFAYAERLRLCFGRGTSLDVRMAGGRARTLIENNTIRCFPSIRRFERDAVVFENDAKEFFDLVIFATGFAPALRFLAVLEIDTCPRTGLPLARNMESTSTPNLFFLGLDMARNFQSRFLRGIRNDAAVLANVIAERIATAPKHALSAA